MRSPCQALLPGLAPHRRHLGQRSVAPWQGATALLQRRVSIREPWRIAIETTETTCRSSASLLGECGGAANQTGDLSDQPSLPPVALRLTPKWLWVALLLLAVVPLSLAVVAGPDAVQARTAESPPAIPQGPTVRAAERAAPVHAQTVVLLVIDGIRWQEVFWGVDAKLAPRHGMAPSRVVSAERLVPALSRLRTEQGATVGAPGVGAPMHATGPVYRSLPGYMELLSGVPARHCLSNRCGGVRHPTLMDQ